MKPVPSHARDGGSTLAALVATLAALLWSTRNSLRGAPVADDWAFLHHIRFAPFGIWDSFGAAYYWRPAARQLGMTLESLWMERAPWVGVLVHVVLLAAVVVVLQRILRRVVPPATAALIACTPLLTEGTRVLLIWPSAIQHLLALLAVALAVHESLARRLPTALLAAAVALGSHESAAAVIPVLMLVSRDETLTPRARMAWRSMPLALLTAWLVAYAVARSHGVQLPPTPGLSAAALTPAPELARHLMEALLGLEDQSPRTALLLTLGHGLIVVVGVVVALRQRGSSRGAFTLTALAGALIALPLAWLLPDWNAWRASLPLLALGVGLAGLLASIDTRLLAGFLVLRLVALLLAPSATLTTLEVPMTRSDLSFVRLARLQRIVASSRAELIQSHPSLPAAARIRYWTMPGLAEVGFQQQKAAQVWYRDSTVTFQGFGGIASLIDPPEVVLSYNATEATRPAVVMSREALQLYRLAHAAAKRGDAVAVDSLGALTLAAQPRVMLDFTAHVQFTRASARVALNDDLGADSLLVIARRLKPGHAGAQALAGWIALRRGELNTARDLAARAITLDPNEILATELMAEVARFPRAY